MLMKNLAHFLAQSKCSKMVVIYIKQEIRIPWKLLRPKGAVMIRMRDIW